MSAPVVNAASFDAASYNPGQVVTLTVDYVAGGNSSSETVTTTGEAVDTVTNEQTSFTASFSLVTSSSDPTSWALTDGSPRVYSQVSDSGSVVVFTATA